MTPSVEEILTEHHRLTVRAHLPIDPVTRFTAVNHIRLHVADMRTGMEDTLRRALRADLLTSLPTVR